MKQASYISLKPSAGQGDAVANFLKQGATIVQDTEPGTLLWTALQSADTNQCAIFDTFPNEDAAMLSSQPGFRSRLRWVKHRTWQTCYPLVLQL